MSLLACAETRYVTNYELVKPPDILLRQCNDVDIKYSTNGEIVLSLIELSAEYNICKQKVSALIEFYNITDSVVYNGDYVKEK